MMKDTRQPPDMTRRQCLISIGMAGAALGATRPVYSENTQAQPQRRSAMKITWSVFPKFFREMSPEALAGMVRDVGLDTTNIVIRDGYWVELGNMRETLPRFVGSLRAAGLETHYATADFRPADLLLDDTPLAILADNGVTDFRVAHYGMRNVDIRQAMANARSEMERLAAVCEKRRLRAIYQLHHKTLIPSAHAAWSLIHDLPESAIGVKLDPGNQLHDGLDDWARAAGLLQGSIAAMGVKDAVPARDVSGSGKPDKGWSFPWGPLQEGIINWHDVVRALHSVDFKGTFVFMPFFDTEDPVRLKEALKNDVAYLRRVVSEVEKEETKTS